MICSCALSARSARAHALHVRILGQSARPHALHVRTLCTVCTRACFSRVRALLGLYDTILEEDNTSDDIVQKQLQLNRLTGIGENWYRAWRAAFDLSKIFLPIRTPGCGIIYISTSCLFPRKYHGEVIEKAQRVKKDVSAAVQGRVGEGSHCEEENSATAAEIKVSCVGFIVVVVDSCVNST